MKALLGFLALGLAFTASQPSFAAGEESDPLLVESRITPREWSPGQAGELKLNLSLPEGYHGYEDQFRLTVLEPDGFIVGAWKVAPVKNFFDKFSKKDRRGVEGKAVLTAPLEAPSKFTKDAKTMKVELVYQACAATFCLFPTTRILEIPIALHGTQPAVPAAVTPAAAPETGPPVANAGWLSSEHLHQLVEQNPLLALFFVFLAGVLTSFTPCIFPMIPITLAILGHHSEQRSRAQNFSLSVFYVLGIATTYSILGLIAASSGAVFGASLGNPWVLSGVCALFLVMALSMYGFFELQVPAFLRNSLGNRKTAPGFVGAYLSGLIAGLVASPCVGPVLVSILAFVAATGSKFYGFFLLFAYALGLGLIFLVLGVFTEFTRRLPRSGPWLESVKFLLGSLMLGAFYYYLSMLIPERWHDGALGVGLVVLGSTAGAFGSLHGHPMLARIRKGFAQALLVLGFGYLVLAVFDLRPFLERRMVNPEETVVATEWKDFSEQALKDAAATGKPVIVDFWADWCAACHELEQRTFSDNRFKLRSRQFVLLKFDATKTTPELRELKARWKIQGLPTVLFINPKGVWLDGLTLTEFERPDAFMNRMDKALN